MICCDCYRTRKKAAYNKTNRERRSLLFFGDSVVVRFRVMPLVTAIRIIIQLDSMYAVGAICLNYVRAYPHCAYLAHAYAAPHYWGFAFTPIQAIVTSTRYNIALFGNGLWFHDALHTVQRCGRQN